MLVGEEEVRGGKKEKFELKSKSDPVLIGAPETTFLFWARQKE